MVICGLLVQAEVGGSATPAAERGALGGTENPRASADRASFHLPMGIILGGTFTELAEHRVKVARALQDLTPGIQSELVRSEDLGASGQPPLATWLRQFDSSDWFILLLGWRYGYMYQKSKRSLRPNSHTSMRRSM